MIVLSSFNKRPDGIPAFSVARWQPRGHHLPELRFLAPIDQFGHKIKGFYDHREYRRLYKAVLQTRKEAILNWLDSLSPKQDMTLVCWCTIEQQRLKGYDTIMCHTILLGNTIRKHRPDILVFVDADRFQHSIFKHRHPLFDPRKRRRRYENRKGRQLF